MAWGGPPQSTLPLWSIARGGPVSPYSHCSRCIGRPCQNASTHLVSPYSHCSQWHGEAQPMLAHTLSQSLLTLQSMAWGGPSRPRSHCRRWHGEDLVSPHSHCGRWRGEDLVIHAHTVVGNVVHAHTVVDAWGRRRQSTLTLWSMAWGGPSHSRTYCGRQCSPHSYCIDSMRRI